MVFVKAVLYYVYWFLYSVYSYLIKALFLFIERSSLLFTGKPYRCIWVVIPAVMSTFNHVGQVKQYVESRPVLFIQIRESALSFNNTGLGFDSLKHNVAENVRMLTS